MGSRVNLVKWTADVDWREVLQGPRSTRPGLHWHGYFWRGQRHLLMSFQDRPQRVPGNHEFKYSELPPDATCDNLRRPRKLVKGTWDTPEAAAAWMRRWFDVLAPVGYAHNPANSELYHAVTLSHGKDSAWCWGYPEVTSRSAVHLVVVCCPNEAPDDLPCPTPERGLLP